MSQLTDISHFFERGTRLTLSKPIRPWVVIPLLFNIVLFGLLYWLAGHYINLWIDQLVASWHFDGLFSFMNELMPWLAGLLALLVWLLLLVVFASLFTIMVQLAASPFLGLLAEQVNRDTCSEPLPEESLAAMIRRTLVRELVKLNYWLWRALGVLLIVIIFYFVPGLNLLASVLWFTFCGWMLAMQYIDFGADCRLVSLTDMRRAMQHKRWLVLGFGCIMLALTLLPLVNLVIMPVGVVTGTLIWNERLAVALKEPRLAAPNPPPQLEDNR